MLKRAIKSFRRRHGLESKTLRCDYRASGLGVRNMELGFLEDPVFKSAWQKAVAGAEYGWSGLIPDIRWRTHIALWAARRGLMLEGDFVECGVYTGLMSLTLCHAVEFQKLDRKFFLFDTYDGIPVEGLPDEERRLAEEMNKGMYKDVYAEVQKHFAPFPNAVLVRGRLPETLDTVKLSRIAYLSIDLNNATAERPCIERLWPLLSQGATVVIDDYAHKGHRPQYDMWNEFAAKTRTPIVTLPTGQGLMIKT
jgi:O-methyltransferase